MNEGRYYAHPRNLFWPIVAELSGVTLRDASYAQRLAVLRRHGIALWDVIESCERRGSLDTAIRNAQIQTFEPLLAQLPALRAVAFNGRLAARREHWFRMRGYHTHVMPSTSPANAGTPRDAKIAAWRAIARWCAPVSQESPEQTLAAPHALNEPFSPTSRRALRPVPD